MTSELQQRRTRADPRREQTRALLIVAARTVFERDGYHDAKLADITAEAGYSSGTLYNYYRSKREIFRDVIETAVNELTADPATDAEGIDAVQRLRAANRSYVQGYRRHARLLNLLPQVAESDDDLRALGRSIIDRFQNRAVDAIRRWQSAGLIYDDLDPVYTAHALTFMVEHLVIAGTVDDYDHDEDLLVDTVNKIWERALGFESTDHERRCPDQP